MTVTFLASGGGIKRVDGSREQQRQTSNPLSGVGTSTSTSTISTRSSARPAPSGCPACRRHPVGCAAGVQRRSCEAVVTSIQRRLIARHVHPCHSVGVHAVPGRCSLCCNGEHALGAALAFPVPELPFRPRERRACSWRHGVAATTGLCVAEQRLVAFLVGVETSKQTTEPFDRQLAVPCLDVADRCGDRVLARGGQPTAGTGLLLAASDACSRTRRTRARCDDATARRARLR